MKKRKEDLDEVKRTQRWFAREVTYEGEPYMIDAEQAAAVVDDSQNAIVAARAGSGKTRTIVAKIVYLVAKRGIKPEEITAFVFNANAAVEINARLSKMRVRGKQIIHNVQIASTFHAFARKIVFDVCGGKQKCGEILADDKAQYIGIIIKKMLDEPEWAEKINRFIFGKERMEDARTRIDGKEIGHFVGNTTQFVSRAQQRFLVGENNLSKIVKKRIANEKLGIQERRFVELGLECYRRYHWYLLDENARNKLLRKNNYYMKYGTDFNLLMSWASKLIERGDDKIREILKDKKYLLIDEYQDFSQLFLAMVMAIRKIQPKVKLFVVGDDWQAINRFAGSDVGYFREFEKYFENRVRRMEITTNYRCDYEIVEMARRFMKRAMNEKGVFKAKSKRAGKVVLVNLKDVQVEHILIDYDENISGEDLIYNRMAIKMLGMLPKKATVEYMKVLVQIIRKNKKASEIMLLHRNNETNIEGISLEQLKNGLRYGLGKLGIMNGEEFKKKVQVMTMHKSKGLEAEVVIILEADEGVIPKTHPDTSLYGIFGETDEAVRDDQKRLFYVAMTRAKKRLYIMHNSAKGAGFTKFLGRGIEKWEN
ncbi:UvrD-helicase domain-containing protein [Candidatus Saccharibacteria bacterium]|nr:UvrD-helicase domain-containing protein [Candidatus Saccharibacteria bacterium]